MPSLIGSEGVIDMEAFGLTIKELLLSWIIVQIILATQSSTELEFVTPVTLSDSVKILPAV